MAKTTFKTDTATNTIFSMVLCGCQNMLHKLCIVYLVAAIVCFIFWIFVAEYKMMMIKKEEYNKYIIYNRVHPVTDNENKVL
jgi:hypothetical protein